MKKKICIFLSLIMIFTSLIGTVFVSAETYAEVPFPEIPSCKDYDTYVIAKSNDPNTYYITWYQTKGTEVLYKDEIGAQFYVMQTNNNNCDYPVSYTYVKQSDGTWKVTFINELTSGFMMPIVRSNIVACNKNIYTNYSADTILFEKKTVKQTYRQIVNYSLTQFQKKTSKNIQTIVVVGLLILSAILSVILLVNWVKRLNR